MMKDAANFVVRPSQAVSSVSIQTNALYVLQNSLLSTAQADACVAREARIK